MLGQKLGNCFLVFFVQLKVKKKYSEISWPLKKEVKVPVRWIYQKPLKSLKIWKKMNSTKKILLELSTVCFIEGRNNPQKIFPTFHIIFDFHVYLLDEVIARNLIATMAFWGQTKARQKCADRLAGSAQKAIVGIQFFAWFCDLQY